MFFKKRFDKLKNILEKNKVKAYLETNPKNIFYLTGAKDSAYPIFVCKNNSYLLAPEMLANDFANTLTKNHLEKAVTILTIGSGSKNLRNLKEALLFIREKELFKALHSDFSSLNFAFYKNLEILVEIKNCENFVNYLRMTKDSHEIEKIKFASRNTFLIAKQIPKILKNNENISESELAKKIDILSIKKCGDKAFDTIAAFGKNTQFPHYVPSKDCYVGNEVLVDFGCKFEEYSSDLTRTFFDPKISSANYVKIYKIVEDVQKYLLDFVRPGKKACEIDQKARELFEKKKVEKYFIHSTGHGVGLDIHERPFLNKSDETILKEGMTITIEPGLYIESIGGVRIEDTILITKKGCEILTR